MNLSGMFVLDTKNRHSNARYVHGLRTDDIVKLHVHLIRSAGASSGNYAFSIGVEKYIGGNPFIQESFESIGEASQNEIFKGFAFFDRDQRFFKASDEPVFYISQLSAQEIADLR